MADISVVMVTPELKTFKSMVGGLGDVADELPRTVANMGVKTTVVSPLYQFVRGEVTSVKRILKTADYSGLDIADNNIAVEFDVFNDRVQARVKTSKMGNVDVVLLEEARYIDVVYSGDLLKDAIVIGRGTLEALKALDIKPKIIHLHDGLSSLVLLSKIEKKYTEDPFFNDIKYIYTVHNAGGAYQQMFDSNRFDELGIDRSHWDKFVWNGRLNLTYFALRCCDACNTVSKDYAAAIKNSETGEGLDQVFRERNIIGIENRIQIGYWRVDQNKDAVKKDLLDKAGGNLDKNKFTIVVPRRLAYQKGVNVLIDILPEVVKERDQGGLGAQVIVMGIAHEDDSLAKSWEEMLKRFQEDFKGRFAFLNMINHPLSKLMYRGGDLLLYFSLPDKEPCGTGYMNALANMTPSLCTNTGGVVGIIEEFDPNTGKGNGFKIDKWNYSSHAFLDKLRYIADIYYNQPKVWKILLKNTVKTDVSMEKMASEYIDFYRKVVGN
jgi:starch synthase